MLGFMFVLFGAAIAAGLAGTGSAVGCGIVGMAASGVVSEDPNKFGRLLLLQALPGTQGIYGMVALFMIINKVVGWGVPLDQIGANPVDLSAGVARVANRPFSVSAHNIGVVTE